VALVALGVALLLSSCSPAPAPLPSPSRLTTPDPVPAPNTPKNIILCIGDGMGFASVQAAAQFSSGKDVALCFQSFPHQASMTHDSAGGGVTDSAASATAIASGVKVSNGVISVRIPGDGSDLPTLLELYQSQGKKVGLVTTSYIEDATSAAFAAHQGSRDSITGIANDYLGGDRPDLLMGGFTRGGLEPAAAANGGYSVAATRTDMAAWTGHESQPLAGLFGMGPLPSELDGDFTTIPRLSEMARKALHVMQTDPEGFFLLLEDENTDEAGHSNNIERQIAATLELSKAVQEVLDWAGPRNDTLILVTADHETGGLTLVAPGGRGRLPEVTWDSRSHTGRPVPVYARGPLSERFKGRIDNAQIVRLLTGKATVQL
jgi:alkaline phosphatase